jgi:tetratricopeptide (TPR) repeat protein
MLDRVLTPALGLGGRLLSRPSDQELSQASGRSRGGEEVPSAVAALEAGRRALNDGHYAEALVQFGLAIERDEGSAWAWHGRGDALQLAGDPESALASYDRALALQSNSALAHLGRGNALEALERATEARAAWEAALALDPVLEWAKQGLTRLGAPKA